MCKIRTDVELLCQLPDGYDSRTQITAYSNGAVAVHPDMPPLFIDSDGNVEQIFPRLAAEPNMKDELKNEGG